MVLGFLISMGSTFRLVTLIKGNPEPFATSYTIGNILGICSTCFLYGPWTQFKKMFAPTRFRFVLKIEVMIICLTELMWYNRMVSTAVYIFFLGLTLFLAFYPKPIVLRMLWLVLSILCQFLALVWYTLSFIPFARDILKKFCSDYCCRSCSLTQQVSIIISLFLFRDT